MGNLSCAIAGDVLKDSYESSSTVCLICSDGSASASARLTSHQENAMRQELFRTFEVILESPRFPELAKPRVWAMIALKQLVAHAQDPSQFDIASSALARWCLDSHCSAVRELRIAARSASACLDFLIAHF